MDRLTITTYDRDLYGDLKSAQIDGIIINRRINTVDCANPEIMGFLTDVQTIVLSLSGSVCINLLSSWLYDRINNNPSEKIKINGVEICGDKNNINIQINNCIQVKEGSES